MGANFRVLACCLCLAAATAIPLAAQAKKKPPVIEQVQVGVTEYGYILGKYGDPAQNRLNPDGTRELVYAWTKARIRPVTFVPVLNLVGGGGGAQFNSQILKFGPDGKLISLRATDTRVECAIWSGCSGAQP